MSASATQGGHNNRFNGPLSIPMQVSRYQKNTCLLTPFVYCLWLLYNVFNELSPFPVRSIASSLHICWLWQSFSITSLQVFYDLSLCISPSTSNSMHFSPGHFRSFLKHTHTILAYITAPLLLCHLFLVCLSTHYT